MNVHPITAPASPSLASPLFDASFDSIESLTTTFTSPVVLTLETTTVTEVALGYHRNQQYCITAMTTSTGAVAERYAYTAYGQSTILNASGTVLTSSAVGNRYTYTGREWDETLGLHHFRARWMSPLAGRFLGRDPIGYLSDVGLYRYIFSSPMSRLDPSGLFSVMDGGVDKPKVASEVENACNECCCCPTKITATAQVSSVSSAQVYSQSVTITISVTMTYKKAPAGAKSTKCAMAFLEFVDPVSTDELSPYLKPDSWFDYTRIPEGQWLDQVQRFPSYFDDWKNYQSPESKACNGSSTWTGTDQSQQPRIKAGQVYNFWQLVGVRGGADCKCKPPNIAILNNIIYDPQQGNPTFQSHNLPLPKPNRPGRPDLPNGLEPLPVFP
ncbi:MAG: RHS repeat domain-containing protein [Pirellula sp.]|jgi:RHS repeat-associated protein